MGIEDWNTDTSGKNVVMLPLFRYELIAADASIGLKLDHFKEGDRDGVPSGRLQLILTAQQAYDLGRALQSASLIVQAEPPPGKQS